MKYEPLDKKAKKVMFITALIQAVAFAAVLVLIAGFAFSRDSVWGYVLIAAVLLLSCLWVLLVPAVRFKRYRYLIAPDRIEIIEGVFWVKRTLVPIDRIHQIEVTRGPIDSAFKVAKVSVITAGDEATMRFLQEEKANEIALHLNARIREKLGGTNDVQ